jgi:hypothetical protein
MTSGRIPKLRVSAAIERDDYEVLLFAGWNFSKEIREFCHASANMYRAMLGRPGLEKIVS